MTAQAPPQLLVSDATSSSDNPYPGGPWLTEPTDDDIRRFQELVTRTGRPEDFQGTNLTKPHRDGDHRVIARFYADPKLRGDERCPCAVCSGQRPKYHEGRLLWSPDGWLRLVGHVCGRRFFGHERFRRWEKEQRARQRLGDADAFLLANFDKITLLRDYIEALRPAAFKIRDTRTKLRKDLPKLIRGILRQAKEHGGQMVIISTRSVTARELDLPGLRSSQGVTSSENVELFGRFVGLRLIGDEGFDPLNTLNRLTNKLPPKFPSREAMTDHLLGLSALNRIGLADALRKAPAQLEELRGAMEDARTFLTLPALNRLTEWSAHPDSPIRFVVIPQSNAVTFRYMSDERLTIAPLDTLHIPPIQLPTLLEALRSTFDSSSSLRATRDLIEIR